MTRREQFVLTLVGVALLVGAGTLQYRSRSAPEIEAPPPDRVETTMQDQVLEPELPTVKSPEKLPLANTAPVVVSILGGVARPGVYQLEAGARVQDLIAQAGDLTEFADLSDINLAAHLIDGTTLTVPTGASVSDNGTFRTIERRATGAVWNPPEYTLSGWQSDDAQTDQPHELSSRDTPESPTSVQAIPQPSGGLLDLNRATAPELRSLPGIGPVLADAIIQYREQRPFRTIDELDDVPGIGAKRLDAVRGLVAVH